MACDAAFRAGKIHRVSQEKVNAQNRVGPLSALGGLCNAQQKPRAPVIAQFFDLHLGPQVVIAGVHLAPQALAPGAGPQLRGGAGPQKTLFRPAHLQPRKAGFAQRFSELQRMFAPL